MVVSKKVIQMASNEATIEAVRKYMDPKDDGLEPTWEVATLFPPQGSWDESEYISLTNTTNHLIELKDGYLELPPMPTTSHQRIVGFLLHALGDFVKVGRLGEVLFFVACECVSGKRQFESPTLYS